MLEKPRARFCWLCGQRLRGNHYSEVEVDEHMRILHKCCAEDLARFQQDFD